jgi:hypothetical protein
MSHLLVYATAESRLHADLMVVRLKRAGIGTDRISVLHPQAARPNSALCWLDGASSVQISSGETASVSGHFRLSLESSHGTATASALVDRLRRLGLSRDQSSNIEESLLENRMVIAVEVTDEFELPSIFRTLRSLDAEKINTADLDHRVPEEAHGLRRQHAAVSSAEFSYSGIAV